MKKNENEKKVKTVYTEPADYFPEEIRKKYKLGEFNDEKDENESLTELVFIIDRSGSMSGLEGDTIGGFNSMIKEQREKDGKCFVSTMLFDDETKVLHDRLPLEKIKKLTEKDYRVRGCTALLDAIGKSIVHVENIHKYAREEDVPENTVFVIITDGYENASREFTGDKIKKMIEKKKEKNGWEFLFIGANIDAVTTASQMGIDADRAVNYIPDGKGTEVVYNAVSKAVGCVRKCAPLGADWCEEVEKDFKKRK